MVNEPGKLTGAERARKEEPGAGQFAIPKGGEEEENYEQLLDQYGARKFAEGEVMKGTVLKITDTDVIVDIGYKSEGIIPVSQFIDPDGTSDDRQSAMSSMCCWKTPKTTTATLSFPRKKPKKSKSGKTSRRHYNENTHHSRPRYRTHQRRSFRRHRHSRFSAGIADRCAAGEESRFSQGQRNRMPRHQT